MCNGVREHHGACVHVCVFVRLCARVYLCVLVCVCVCVWSISVYACIRMGCESSLRRINSINEAMRLTMFKLLRPVAVHDVRRAASFKFTLVTENA